MTSASAVQPAFAWADRHVHATFYRLVDPNESARVESMVEEGMTPEWRFELIPETITQDEVWLPARAREGGPDR